MTEADLPELPEGEYYVRDLIGMEAVLEDGSHLGTVTDVIQNTAQDIFEVETDEGKQVLIPKVPAFRSGYRRTAAAFTVRLIRKGCCRGSGS